ncbi:hypothetical protein NEOLEDRAFT_1138613 [Neolentinus lepideus HHB14362 ss-1]|uniref:STE3-domain-containing protein n=1 Tax=Neolentinus lepideus HHB14362 ss-1 TaxID=1314782 RepID=A0A165Q861_9AGAM|nr:hypothetical protein NEOLEDRAFT_1138613 [Neolentinus lepideus HHB14362 ss-1]
MTWGDSELDYYFWIQIVGGICLTLLIVSTVWTAKSERRPFNPVLMSFYISFWLDVFPSALFLYYAGKVADSPSLGVCLASAVISTSSVLCNGAASLALTLEIWYQVQSATKPATYPPVYCRRITFLLTAFPFMYPSVWAIVLLVVGLENHDVVMRTTFYCIISEQRVVILVGVFAFVVAFPASIFAVWVIFILIKTYVPGRWHTHRQLDVPFIVRNLVFMLYILVASILCLAKIWDRPHPSTDLYTATYPFAVALVFGGQMAVRALWSYLRMIPLIFGRDVSSAPQRSHSRPTPSRVPTPKLESFVTEGGGDLLTDDVLFSARVPKENRDSVASWASTSSCQSLPDDEGKPWLPTRPRCPHLPTREGDVADVGPWQRGSPHARSPQAIYRQGEQVHGLDMCRLVEEGYVQEWRTSEIECPRTGYDDQRKAYMY